MVTTANAHSTIRPPATVLALTGLLGLFASISIVGSFIFAFPEGWPLGSVVGVVLLALGATYLRLAWSLPHGEPWARNAALALPIVHVVAMSALDLVLLGEVPSENYPVLGVVTVMLVLSFVPSTRRFFDRQDEGTSATSASDLHIGPQGGEITGPER